MNRIIISFLFLFVLTSSAIAQKIRPDEKNFTASKVFMHIQPVHGYKTIQVVKDSSIKAVDEPTFAIINNLEFSNGSIEMKVLSKRLPTAGPNDRGFIGIAFRINETKTKFECIYIRPANGRAEEQVRRNHSTQYFSYPDYKFDRLRKESPEKYESYADIGLNEWITLKIVVKGNSARLFVNNREQPALIVNDLKHGADSSGSVGLFVDVGTEGYFRDIKVIKE
ncbi:MAG: DUF1080 domain-containing protein [Lacibacter sp.]|jgi:hypothetical protein